MLSFCFVALINAAAHLYWLSMVFSAGPDLIATFIYPFFSLEKIASSETVANNEA